MIEPKVAIAAGPLTIVCAAAIAASVSALTAAVAFGAITIAPAALIVAAPHAILAGCLFAWLQNQRRATFLRLIAAAVLIGTLPIGVLTLGSTADQASSNGIATVIDGTRTWRGWIEYLKFLLLFGGCGAAGGAAFWMGIRFRSRWSQMILAIVALALIAGISAVPAITRDRTCHNTMRDGRTSIGSQVGAEFVLGEAQWPEVIDEFRTFSLQREWSLQIDLGPPSEFYRQINISACEESGTAITALAVVSNEPRIGTGVVVIGVYQPQGGASWREPTAAFLRRAMQRWPGRVRFKDEKGEIIAVPIEATLRQIEKGG